MFEIQGTSDIDAWYWDIHNDGLFICRTYSNTVILPYKVEELVCTEYSRNPNRSPTIVKIYVRWI